MLSLPCDGPQDRFPTGVTRRKRTRVVTQVVAAWGASARPRAGSRRRPARGRGSAVGVARPAARDAAGGPSPTADRPVRAPSTSRTTSGPTSCSSRREQLRGRAAAGSRPRSWSPRAPRAARPRTSPGVQWSATSVADHLAPPPDDAADRQVVAPAPLGGDPREGVARPATGSRPSRPRAASAVRPAARRRLPGDPARIPRARAAAFARLRAARATSDAGVRPSASATGRSGAAGVGLGDGVVVRGRRAASGPTPSVRRRRRHRTRFTCPPMTSIPRADQLARGRPAARPP